MNRSSLALRWILPAVVIVPVGLRAAAWWNTPDPGFRFDRAMSEQGKELFVHVWEPHDALSPGGDGLGPVFNAKSCVECHHQGGAGGGGPLENNVTAFTIGPVTRKPVGPFDRAEVVSPAGEPRAGVVHAFATSNEFRETLANLSPRFRSVSKPELADLLPSGPESCPSPPKIGVASGVDISHRNTPALFGANLIDSIPDRVIIANERAQRLKWGFNDPRSESLPVGRAIRLANGGVGKFGWKAQIGTLSDFVRAACANELGLGNPSNAQPASMASNNYKAPGVDLTDEQCDQMTAFVSSLPRPIETEATTERDAQVVAFGRDVFHSIGCTDCHTPDVGNVKGIYSDLLVHSMGKILVGGGSYGQPPAELPEFPEGSGPNPSEWRTPPLWGVADSAPYMHDGRAATLRDAIRLHGGQAERSADLFAKLPADQQHGLMQFLMSLRAPKLEPVPQTNLFAAGRGGERSAEHSLTTASTQ